MGPPCTSRGCDPQAKRTHAAVHPRASPFPRPASARRVQDEAWSRRRVKAALREAREADHSFEGGAILGSMCTAPHAAAHEAYAMFLETNLGDPGHFPGTARLEQEVLEDFKALTHAPAKGAARFLTGGTEANLLAMMMARETTGKKEVVLPDSAHFSFDKAARMLGMRLKRVPTTPSGHADATRMAKAITTRTALVVAVAGTTELGLVDPIKPIAAAAKKKGVALHVDAAFGGYVLPFLEEAGRTPRPWDFRVPGVTSIGLDPHKMGMAAIPGGALIVRDGNAWDSLRVDTPYVSTDGQTTLMGTRPGAAVAACWAVHRRLGKAGFESVVETCLDNSTFLAAGLHRLGVELVAEPELNVVTFRCADPEGFAKRIEDHGFRINIVPRFQAIRIVVNPHVTRKALERFLAVLPEAL